MGLEKAKNIEKNTIDAVVLWVDGNDLNHKEKIYHYVDDKSKIYKNNFRTKFDQVNEIEFTIDSILKFAPFIRNIFIVTDEQIPDFLKNTELKKTYNNVKIIDHKVIFSSYEEYLPVFNCRPIESCIYRIPDLAEHFIYFNDDFFLINETKPEDFFKNGMPVLRGKWKRFDSDLIYKKWKKPRIGHKHSQQKAAKILGFKKYYLFYHTPHPLRKSTFEKYFENNKDVFISNIKYKFRNENQFTPQGLANHIEIMNKTCVLKDDINLIYFRSYKKPLLWYKFKLNLLGKNKLFLGMQSLDLCPENIINFLFDWLKTRIKK
jgi:hypothetical protein